MTVTHFLTFDTEHWYESWRQRGLSWDSALPDCDSGCVERILDLLEASNQKATFFFTGNFAREFPHVARECVRRGHEVASHSQDHTLLTKYAGRKEFAENLLRSLDCIEQACGQRPVGFRAPKWTLLPENAEMALDVLAEANLLYDSSVFPGHLNISSPCRIETRHGVIFEIPATGWKLGGRILPVGGAWFRVFPVTAARAMFRQHEKSGLPAMFYAHPYDLNPGANCPRGTPMKLRCIRRLGIHGAWRKLESILKTHRFTSIKTWLESNIFYSPIKKI